MKTQHTPGPWRVGKIIDSSERTVYIRIESLPGLVSTTGVFGHKPNGKTAGRAYRDRFGTDRHKPVISADEAQANARLIAAAPDLLAALQEVARIWGAGGWKNEDGETPDIEPIFAAIAKATQS